MATNTLPVEGMLRQALEKMESALEMLDRAKAPAHIGAHLDLAITELDKALAHRMPDQGSAQSRSS